MPPLANRQKYVKFFFHEVAPDLIEESINHSDPSQLKISLPQTSPRTYYFVS